MNARFLVALGLAIVAREASGDSAAPDLPKASKLLKIQLPRGIGRPPTERVSGRVGPGRGLGATVRMLRTQPNIPHRSAETPAQRLSSDARLLKDMFWGYRLSTKRYQRRATKILGRVSSVYRRDLARPGLQGIAVVEPYPHVNARVHPGGGGPDLGISTVTSLHTGGMVVARDLVDQAETLGAVLAAALPGRGLKAGGRNGLIGTRLMKRMWRFTALPPATLITTTRRARRLRDGVLASVLARESGYWVSNSGARALPNARATNDSHRELERLRDEKRGDLIAAQIAMRMGVSPSAILAYHMWAAMKLAQSKKKRKPDWARFVSRYDRVYRYLERQMNRPRLVYAEGQRPAAGRPLMTERMKQDLRAMPTAEELVRFIRPNPKRRKLRAAPTHMLHRLHFVHDERAGAAPPGVRSIRRRLSPLVRAEVRAVGQVREDGHGAGTAFLIKAPKQGGIAWVMTNAHVVKSEANASALEIAFEDAGRRWTGRVRRALFFAPDVDAAVLEVKLPDLPASFAAARLLERPVRAGEALHAIGFPGIQTAAKDPAIRRRVVAAPRGTSFTRSLKTISLGREKGGGAVEMLEGSQVFPGRSFKTPFIRSDATTLPGSSGSPVFAAGGGVVALHARAARLSDALSEPGGAPDTYSVPMERVLARLRQERPELYRELVIVR